MDQSVMETKRRNAEREAVVATNVVSEPTPVCLTAEENETVTKECVAWKEFAANKADESSISQAEANSRGSRD